MTPEELINTPEVKKVIRDSRAEVEYLCQWIYLRWSTTEMNPQLIQLLESLSQDELKLLQKFSLIVAARAATVRVQ